MTNEYATSSEICEYEDFNSSKRPKMTSKVWEDMERIQTSDGSKVLCKHCGKLLQDNCGTSHLKRHLVICLKRSNSADIITKNSMVSVCHRGNGSGKEPGSNTVLMVRPLKVEPQSQITYFSETPNNRAQTVIASTEASSSPIRELHQKTSSILLLPSIKSPKNHRELTLDDVEMKAFYASLDAEASVVTPPQDTSAVTELSNTTPCEESKKALKTLQDLLSKDFSILLHSGQSGTMKSTIEHLSELTADDVISAELRLLLLEVSREFTRWSCDYNDASRKIESASTNILKADKLEEGLEANKNQFKEVLSLENELSNQLASLEQRKKELEEQINAIKAHISVSQSAKNTAAKRKREVFEEAKTLKAQRDELREQLPHMRDECEVAKKIQANINAEWSKLGEKVNQSLDGVNCKYLNQPQNI
ncbi:putative transcription factor/ chromatin remodeling BED-type(Zn) family [Lupinus albus]|uniref:Putative transcription factor/ chromatin remodeling BED-type(Zn) family n=1 Tax=Lupinus albus TaxID=3870 RepID=A0A6A4NL89_LUPAL|nr:putative transcription factor/ chromatin remodeling BED-type(Zn) family [Lupinus albus]